MSGFQKVNFQINLNENIHQFGWKYPEKFVWLWLTASGARRLRG